METETKVIQGVPPVVQEVYDKVGLPVPPLPVSALERMVQVDDDFFATGNLYDKLAAVMGRQVDLADFDDAFTAPTVIPFERDVEIDSPTHEDFPELFPEPGTIRFLGCGLSGQNTPDGQFYYVLNTIVLRISVVLPFGNPPSEAESATIRQCCDLLAACYAQVCWKDENDGRLDVALDASGCRWRRRDAQGNMLASGSGMESLAEDLKKHQRAELEPVEVVRS